MTIVATTLNRRQNKAWLQGVWLEISLDGGGVKDEVDGLGRVALVDLEASR